MPVQQSQIARAQARDGTTTVGKLHKLVSARLFRRGVRNFSVEIRYAHKNATHYAVVEFSNGVRTDPEPIEQLDKSYLEYGVGNINLRDEFIALCVMLQP